MTKRAAKKCVVCGKPRKPPKEFKYVSRTVWEADAYCSRPCAEADNGR